jgi:hypothetical protein
MVHAANLTNQTGFRTIQLRRSHNGTSLLTFFRSSSGPLFLLHPFSPSVISKPFLFICRPTTEATSVWQTAPGTRRLLCSFGGRGMNCALFQLYRCSVMRSRPRLAA